MWCTPFLYLPESGPAAGSQNTPVSAGIGVRLLFEKRFLVNAGRNALKALKYADKRVDVLKANPLRDKLDLRLRVCQQPFGPVHTKTIYILAERNAGLLLEIMSASSESSVR